MVREYSHRMWITFQIPCKTMDKEIYREKAGYKLILPFKSVSKKFFLTYFEESAIIFKSFGVLLTTDAEVSELADEQD